MAKKRGKSKVKKPESVTADIHPAACPEVLPISTALTPVNQPMKVCRLCESKDGPFLNIFDAEKTTAKKVEDLMPFIIAENDDLPHNICFRCSAKVEELHEFIQKCIKTQENLCTALGKKERLAITKKKPNKLIYEGTLKRQICNDDVCDAVIKKAMKSLSDPKNVKLAEEGNLLLQNNQLDVPIKPDNDCVVINDDSDSMESCILDKVIQDATDHNPSLTRSSRSKNFEPVDFGLERLTRSAKLTNKKSANSSNKQPDNVPMDETNPAKNPETINDISLDVDLDKSIIDLDPVEEETEVIAKPFNIMEHISTIKVNGVGELYQCKLCNRNFLNKDVVKSHGCAKSGFVPKDFTQNVVPPEAPKAPTVKYINTKFDTEPNKPTVSQDSSGLHTDSDKKNSTETERKVKKTKIGPASKVRRDAIEIVPEIGMVVTPIESTPPEKLISSLQFATLPSLNRPYKLVPGPNNTFNMVEEASSLQNSSQVRVNVAKKRSSGNDVHNNLKISAKDTSYIAGLEEIAIKKSKPTTESSEIHPVIKSKLPQPGTVLQPYPVGLFHTVPNKFTNVYPTSVTAPVAPIFSTAALKKQSYTVLQTDNPSKLVISTKPQGVAEEIAKKRATKSNQAARKDADMKQSLADIATTKNDNFFTFINVDPLLQPSYVLPTDSLQESRISTSIAARSLRGNVSEQERGANDTERRDYTCNMCGEKFTREKKLLAHIHLHYNKMDKEDQIREKTVRKRGKKSI